MKNAIRSIALVAAAMSLPVLAAEPSAVAGDPTWPAIEKPAPALAVNGPAVQAPVDITQVEIQGANPALAIAASGQEAQASAVSADPTWPAVSRTAPAIALGGAAPAHVASK